MKTKYILHGGYTRLDNEFNNSFFREFIKDVNENGTVLMCFFASGDEDKTETYNELIAKLAKYSKAGIKFLMAKPETFIADVTEASAVYFHGGSTPVLLRALERYTEFKFCLSNKTIAGSSAGAYMMATYGTAHTEENVRKGLGIVPYKVVCHHNSPTLPPTATSMEELIKLAPEMDIIYLKDCEWKLVSAN